MSDITNSWKDGIAWSEDLETGYGTIDNQHKQLFKLANDLIESFQKGNNKVTITKTLVFLSNYTFRHFDEEEKIALAYGYPEYDEHKKMHKDFTKTVNGFVKEYKEGNDSGELLSAVIEITVEWLKNHIHGEDFKIANHIRETDLKIDNLKIP